MGNKTRMRATSIVKGTLMLSVAGVAVRILGAVFRIPLTHIIGAEGIGIYSLAFPLYNLFLVIASAGLPSAVAAWVSKSVGMGDYALGYKGFKAALCFLFATGTLFAAVLFFSAPLVGAATHNAEVVPIVRAISFSVLFVSVISAFRGFFQGMCHMTPTAISQIWEQIVKVGAGLLFAYIMGKRGGYVWGATGAVIGISISEFTGLLAMIIMFLRRRGEILALLPQGGTRATGIKYTQILGELLRMGIPLMLGSMVIPVVMMCDQYIVIHSLKKTEALYTIEGFLEYCASLGISAKGIASIRDAKIYMGEAFEGYVSSVAASLYGIYTGSVMPLVNLPSVLVMSLSTSSLPVVARERAVELSLNQKRGMGTAGQCGLVMKISSLMLTPFAVAFFFLAEDIMSVLYKGAYTPFEMETAVSLLKISAPSVLLMGIFQSAATLMQAISKERVPPIITSLCSLGVRLPLTVLLCMLASVNVMGVAISNLAFFAVAAIIGVILLCVFIKDKGGAGISAAAPLLPGGLMGCVMYFTLYACKTLGGGSALRAVISLITGGVAYLTGCIFTGLVDKGNVSYVKGRLFKGRRRRE